MPQGQYKINEVIEVTYQATEATTGLADVTMEIYDESGAKDVPNFPDVTMTEIDATGRYTGTFTPDENGKWRVMINSAVKPGKSLRDYDVISHNIHSVGGSIAASEANIRGVDSDTLKDLSDQIDNISGAADSPPIIG